MMSGCIDIVNYSYAWMGMWTYTIMSLTTTIDFGLLAQSLGDWPEFLGHSWSSNANDVKVHWLRSQTHMEWFLHLLQLSTWCFEHSFLCCGWGNGSTIMSLTPNLLACLSRTRFLGVHWLRPQTHMGCFPNPLQTCTR